MLKRIPNPTFPSNVRVTVPGEDEPVSVRFEFKHMTLEGLRQWFKESEGKPSKEALLDLVAGWHEGFDEPFSAEALADYLDNYPALAMEIVRGYRVALTESRVKN